MVNAAITPAMVAWMPELKMQNHNTTPISPYPRGSSYPMRFINTITAKGTSASTSHSALTSRV